ncbi:MAG: SHOCT domain-containing protein [Polaromonas sp.]|jgi:putative membrane protein|nr:SHOCT domain-containing protein [Polaromonas sp.]
MWDDMMMWGGGWGRDWGLFGLMHILWWVLIILGIVALARLSFGRGARGFLPSEEDRALAILRERFARGEIDKAEFEERKRDLGA